jgi:hypothetical protein
VGPRTQSRGAGRSEAARSGGSVAVADSACEAASSLLDEIERPKGQHPFPNYLRGAAYLSRKAHLQRQQAEIRAEARELLDAEVRR